MEGRFRRGSSFRTELEDDGISQTPEPENLTESPRSSGAFGDVMRLPSTSSPKRSRRSIQKRVISIPIKEPEGSRLKGEGAPPSDSWAWRKYGQKPIKGSPYPRGYYRCSSSKGCPARKQVERSRDDPTMLIITYSCEHNHPWPAPRNGHHHHNHHNVAAANAAMDDAPNKPEADVSSPDPEPEQDHEPEAEPDPAKNKFTDIKEESPDLMLINDEFGWFTGMETTTSSLLETPFFDSKAVGVDADMAMFFPMREEDESLYADLGELPECSVVFRHRDVGTEVQIC
ncbi:probable WRKY transcription factor 65 [Punica granatum]|uniref:WRKY domain-containing protein n=2 Tax=Punica granatum TaxID=22663 RepID=A0A218WL70_PUNGR|nr:probable WRKY transcription factor 65 [Punica granatum]OWM72981.1 hypothetical protein CDL15_Pgr001095 [Punica granatum]PKI69030.1 hypothetical protein CRG98_010499 [Punica granatum]